MVNQPSQRLVVLKSSVDWSSPIITTSTLIYPGFVDTPLFPYDDPCPFGCVSATLALSVAHVS
jgi:hypothetical protein